jgi:hypothetical protein
MIKLKPYYAVAALILSLLGCDSSGRDVENRKQRRIKTR